ncbi:MAG: Asp-tRNA(Asn)/Glu-tRNA(Gln) amidotransferase subunit GatA [Syntrophomonadaceae bacterium]|nr:Asp-tRNA(Asn)/Glu-tRNA(Gln) amidotransferase subunit GatA [Syntrophomonadaceae bacterium]
MELCQLTAHELKDKLVQKEITATDILDSCLQRVAQVETQVKAFVTLTEESARETARAVDEKGDYRGLAGITCALKDNLCTKGIRTTCSSRMLENFVPPYDATVVRKMKDEQAVILGKLNMDEFAMGSSTENSAFFPTSNPWDLERVPGGSSGGSAAAVAADEVIYALGSDTGGSIRQPAAFCGVVGMKPTYGRVSRYGLVAFASSLDQIGSLTKDVTDCALVLNLISGYDKMDSTSVNAEVPDYTRFLVPDIKGFKIGVPREYFQAGVDERVKEVIKQALLKMEDLGAMVEETSLPHTEYALPAYYIIAPAEASSNLARFDGVRYGLRDTEAENIIEMFASTRARGFGPEVKRRIMLGTYALSSGYYDAYYLKALKVRRLVKEDFDRAFARYDVLAVPTTPTVAFKIHEKSDNVLSMYMSDIATIPINLAGVPALSIPGGFVDGLPVGLQLIGKPFAEGTILRVAYTFEQNTDYVGRKPKLGVN